MDVTKLSEPDSGGAHGWAFGASLHDLSKVGYVETEFLLAGDATRYALAQGSDYGVDGRWSVEKTSSAPFRTRLLVRRPVDPARFNGTVVVNWNNVSVGYENVPGMSAELIEHCCSGFQPRSLRKNASTAPHGVYLRSRVDSLTEEVRAYRGEMEELHVLIEQTHTSSPLSLPRRLWRGWRRPKR